MGKINSWTEMNWYALGSLLTQIAFLLAGVWFAHNLLRTLQGLLEQFGALLKLSITWDSRSAGAQTRRQFADLNQYWLKATDSSTRTTIEPAESGPGQFSVAWHRLVLWLKAPMHRAEISSWRRFVLWLQSPAGS